MEVTMTQLKQNMATILEAGNQGEQIVVTKNGQPFVRISPITKKSFRDIVGIIPNDPNQTREELIEDAIMGAVNEKPKR